MRRLPKNNQDKNLSQGNKYFRHYQQYLQLIALQLIEWVNLPKGIDPMYLEKHLHINGQIAFAFDEKGLGYYVSKGSPVGVLDIYGNPTQFNCILGNGKQLMSNLFTYVDEPKTNQNAVVINNNDFKQPTFNRLDLFASDLALIKQVQRINIINQKTPYIIFSNQEELLSLKKLMLQVDNDFEKVFVDKKLGDPREIIVHMTPAPYVTDKLQEQLISVWSDCMTFLGIDSVAFQKKERMLTGEVNANNEQNKVSENIYLKSRKEACKLINELFDLNVDVRIRSEVVEQMAQEGEIDATV